MASRGPFPHQLPCDSMIPTTTPPHRLCWAVPVSAWFSLSHLSIFTLALQVSCVLFAHINDPSPALHSKPLSHSWGVDQIKHKCSALPHPKQTHSETSKCLLPLLIITTKQLPCQGTRSISSGFDKNFLPLFGFNPLSSVLHTTVGFCSFQVYVFSVLVSTVVCLLQAHSCPGCIFHHLFSIQRDGQQLHPNTVPAGPCIPLTEDWLQQCFSR